MKIIEQFDISKLRRSIDAGTEQQRQAVLDILQRVKRDGHQAVIDYTKTFDSAHVREARVRHKEFRQAYTHVDDRVIQALKRATEHVRAFHEHQRPVSWMNNAESGTVLGQLVRPLDRVGVYVPGGTAAYPSSVIMSVVPAQVAGVREIAIATPPDAKGDVSPGVLVAADLLGVEEVYKMGGAQAVAALAYGTEQVAAVDKIVGPGNVYVTLAKKEVFGQVDIDMVAGPTDILVVAEPGQDPVCVAADLLSQAEHDPLSAAVCVTTDREYAAAVRQQVEQQLSTLPRRDIAAASVREYGVIYVVQNLDEAFQVVNAIAPEHLELLIDQPLQWLGKVRHAGAIFLGSHSSEPVGDYLAGPSHVLPTYGTARFSSGLNVDTFIKKSSLIAYSRADLERDAAHVINLARYEGLEGHARAIEARVKGIQVEEEGK